MKLKANLKEGYKLLHAGTLALADAEMAGIRIDVNQAKKNEHRLTKKINKIESKIKQTKFYKGWKKHRGTDPNINSNKQLGDYLYGKLGIEPPKRTKTGLGSTDQETLSSLDIGPVKGMLQARKLKKLRDTYLKGFIREQVDGFIHPYFNLHTVRSYRSGSRSPNFQNIPKRSEVAQKMIRDILYPRKGHQLVEVDYSGAETRVAVMYNDDKQMRRYMTDDDADMHSDMASQVYMIDDFDREKHDYGTLRQFTKGGFVFSQFYGDYYVNNAISLACKDGNLPEKGQWKKEQGFEIKDGLTLGEHFINKGMHNLQEYTDYIQEVENDFWYNRFAQYGKWKDKQWDVYLKQGYIDLLSGFRCYGPMNRKEVMNYPIQGTAFHLLLYAFITINNILQKRNMKSRLIGQIHDSIVADVHPSELDKFCKIAQHAMVDKVADHWDWVNIPMVVDVDVSPVDKSWYEMDSYTTLK